MNRILIVAAVLLGLAVAGCGGSSAGGGSRSSGSVDVDARFVALVSPDAPAGLNGDGMVAAGHATCRLIRADGGDFAVAAHYMLLVALAQGSGSNAAAGWAGTLLGASPGFYCPQYADAARAFFGT